MSLHMRTLLLCGRCEKTKETFTSLLCPVVEDGKVVPSIVTVTTDRPLVPGEEYEVLLKGKFPGYVNDHPCVGGVLSFHSDVKLDAVDWVKREANKLG